jgi:hypothetical protein
MAGIIVDSAMGVDTLMHVHGDGTGDITFETTQDALPIMEDAKARQRAGFTGTKELKHAARLPMVAIDAYCARLDITFAEWSQDKRHIRAMLNDPALAYFRIWEGRV